MTTNNLKTIQMKIQYRSLASFVLAMMLFSQELPLHAVTVAPSDPPISVNTTPFITTWGEVYQMIKYIISDITGIEEGEIHYSDYLVRDLGLDSLDMLQLTIECQQFYDIDFNISDLLNAAPKLTVSIMTDIVYHFCTSDEDFVK